MKSEDSSYTYDDEPIESIHLDLFTAAKCFTFFTGRQWKNIKFDLDRIQVDIR